MSRTCRAKIRLNARLLRLLLDLPADARIAAVEVSNDPITVDVILARADLPADDVHDLVEAREVPCTLNAAGKPEWFPPLPDTGGGG